MGELIARRASPREVSDVKLFLTLLVAIMLISSVAVNAAQRLPSPVSIQGQVVCLAATPTPMKPGQPPLCLAALSSTDGSVYSLIPNTFGKELEAMSASQPKVEVQGYLLPGSRILEVISYKPITKFRAFVPQYYTNPWFNF
jgi:hypothetical protein